MPWNFEDRTILCMAQPCIIVNSAHLIDAGDAQSVEEGDKDLRRDDGRDGVAQAEEPEGCAITIRLGGRANHRDARHEAGGKRHRNGHRVHLAATQ